MQKLIDIVSVDVQPNKDSNVTLRLRLYPDAGNPDTDSVLDVSKSAIVKGYVEGQTRAQLLVRARDIMVKEFQQEVDCYILEQSLRDMINTAAIANLINITGVV